MKVIAFGSCMSNLTIAHLKSYGFDQVHSVHHNRSDNFVRYFVDRTAEMLPQDRLFPMLNVKPELEAEARKILLNQYEGTLGYHDLLDLKKSDGDNFFNTIENDRIDVILMDNYMDLAAKLLCWTGDAKYAHSPLFLNIGFYLNEAELASQFSYGQFLTPQESAHYQLRIYKWLRERQPAAKIFFLPYHFCTSTRNPLRYFNARGFYEEFSVLAAREDIHVCPPMTLPPQYTTSEEDWPHYQMDVYRALAGYVYLNTISDWPNPGQPYRMPPPAI